MPEGVNEAIAANDCPKVYVPNPTPDPEQIGLGGKQAVRRLLRCLKPVSGKASTAHILNFVLMDSRHGQYLGGLTANMLKGLGVELISTRLISKHSAPYYDNELLADALLSLA
jgi:hypothetical protein